MDTNERKLYNKEYYTKNKTGIIEKACLKTECEFCKRTVIKNNIIRHQQTNLCKRTQARNAEKVQRLQQITPNENV
jgi:hypothetical protein